MTNEQIEELKAVDIEAAKLRVARARLRRVIELREAGEVCWLSRVYQPDPGGPFIGNYDDDLRRCALSDLANETRIADLERLREAVENFKLVARYRMGESAGLWERIVEPALAKLTPATPTT